MFCINYYNFFRALFCYCFRVKFLVNIYKERRDSLYMAILGFNKRRPTAGNYERFECKLIDRL